LRERASERERYRIDAAYYSVTGEVEKGNQVYEQWMQAYPHDFIPHIDRAVIYFWLGQYDRAVNEAMEATRLNPYDEVSYVDLIGDYISLNRLDEAKMTYERALAHKLDSPTLHGNRYYVAFYEGDTAEMQRQVEWASGRPAGQDLMLSMQSDTEAYMGHFVRARELSRQAAEAAKRNDQQETAAQWSLNAALREAEVANEVRAREQATLALKLASTRDMQIMAALALARAGDTAHAQTMADDLYRQSRLNTMLNGYWLPTIRAAAELSRKHATAALGLLQLASANELGQPPPIDGCLYPVYVRGEAYLQAGRGQQAVVEFQKVIDHRGIVANFVLGALAHLQLGRAKAMTGDKEGARKAYIDFLTLWKDADPDIPILKAAKAEYAKLQ